MLNPVKFADALDLVSTMNKEQLLAMADACATRIEERQERFDQLCAGFYDYLQSIQDEFPNAHVYLIHGNAEKFDVMDCIIPQQTFEICEIGD